MLVFDIETEPMPLEELRACMPPFDESAVAVGNLKDPDKIRDKIEKSRAEHETKFIDRAALSAVTGRVLAIGYYSVDRRVLQIAHGDEKEVVASFWQCYEKMRDAGRSMVGINIHEFDLPFLVRRSWILEVDVPRSARQDRYWDRTFVDLCHVWLCGQKFGSEPANFDAIARAFGTSGKPDGINGAMFAELWHTDNAKAREYLENDLRQPAIWAARMGFV